MPKNTVTQNKGIRWRQSKNKKILHKKHNLRQITGNENKMFVLVDKALALVNQWVVLLFYPKML